jgi:putative nucleotidyltransferase with HDIG domain
VKGIRDRMDPRKLDHYIRKVEQIPTLPVVSQKILSTLNDENVSVKKIAALIERDQALAVKILKMANSAFYGTLSKVSSIDHALVILGITEVRAILMAFSVYHFFPATKENGFDRTRFWTHSIICSQVAIYLARFFKVEQTEDLFLSALIHDMGKVVFDQYFHEEFVEILEHVSSFGDSFSKSEKEVLGITHYQVAAKLLKQWNFPEKVVMHVFYHHAPWQDRDYGTGSVIVYLADLFTKLSGYSCHPMEKKIDLSSFVKTKAMNFIIDSGFDLDYETMQKLTVQIKDLIEAESDEVLKFFEA